MKLPRNWGICKRWLYSRVWKSKKPCEGFAEF